MFTIKDYGLEKLQHGKGVFRDEKKHKAFVESSPKREMAEATLPARVDLTAKVSAPENQGACGSCWDFSLTKAFRSAYMLAGKDPGRLAFNYLLNNCGPQENPMYGCNGGDFIAGQVFLKQAPWLENQDPYTQRDGVRCMNLKPACEPAKTFKVVGPGNRPPTFQELAEAINAGHMLSVDVAVAGSWDAYAGGIYNGSGSGINHMINLVGYDAQSSVDSAGNAMFGPSGLPINGDGYLIVMNNWGTSWGENGYMRTRYGKNQIAETAMYFEVDVPTPPTPPVPPEPPKPEIDWKFIALLGTSAVALVLAIIALSKKKS